MNSVKLFRSCTLTLAIAIAAVAGPPAGAQSNAYQTKTLANGLQVVVVEDHAAPVAQEQIWYRFGSLYETKGKTGLAHALEHMNFRGTPSLSGAGLDDVAARLGAEVNAQTENDTTHFYYLLPADKLELAIHIDADRMSKLLLRQSDWALEKGAVLGEIESDYSQPIFKLYDAVRRAAFPNSPYGLTALGNKADVEASTAADLRKYYGEWYHPNNATLVVTGDVKAADVFRWAEQYFGKIPARPLPATSPPPLPPAPQNASAKVTAEYPYVVEDISYRTEGDLDPGQAATNVLASLINNERSPFYKALVESGLTLGYQADDDTTLHSGLMHVFFVLSPGKTAADLRTAWDATLASLRTSGAPADLVQAAKLQVAAQATYARDSVSGLGNRYGSAIGVARRDPESFDAETAAVTPADVNAVLAKEIVTPTVVGELTPLNPKPGSQSGSKTDSSVSDNFSSRVPNGPIVEAPWVKAVLARPIEAVSGINPTTYTLPNGLRLFVQRVPSNPTVFVSGSIQGSPAFDPAELTGLGSVTGALMSYGSKKYDFAAQRKLTDDLAADVNLGRRFSAHGFAKDLTPLLDLIADAIRNSAFPPNYVQLVRTQALAGVSQRSRDPSYRSRRAFEQLLLPSSDPALREESAASLQAITVDDMKAYAAKFFRPDLTRIVVVGDVQPDEVRKMIADAFGDWTNDGPRPDPALKPIPLPKAGSASVVTARDNVSTRMGTPTISRSDPGFYPLNLLNSIFGGGGQFDTRLMSEVRTKRGLTYGIASSLDVNRYRGTFVIEFSSDPAKVRSALSVVKSQIALIRSRPVTSAELSQAKTKIYARELVAEGATDTIVAGVGNIADNLLPLDYYRTLRQRYDKLTAADLLRAAQRYIHPNHLVEVFEGPKF